MKAFFKAEDITEAKRLAKANDMAMFIWELVYNGWREFKYTDYDYQKAWNKINDLLDEFGIDIDDIT